MPTVFSTSNGRFFFDDVHAWHPDTITIANGWLTLPDGFGLSTTNDLALLTGGRLSLHAPTNTVIGRDLAVTGGQLDIHAAPTVSIGRDLTMAGNSAFYVHAAATNTLTEAAWGTEFAVGNDITLSGNNAWLMPVTHYSDGGSVIFHARNLLISTTDGINAGIKANGYGYGGGVKGHAEGYGPGGGRSKTRGAGGSYGGKGGDGNESGITARDPYGSATWPLDAGSGGGSKSNGENNGGNGGGNVQVRVNGYITVNGTITANGNDGEKSDSTGGGAGGGILLVCRRFSGTGALAAIGGNGSASYGGGGGGGRIAVWSVVNTYTGSLSVANGTGKNNGTPGTWHWGALPPSGTVLMLR